MAGVALLLQSADRCSSLVIAAFEGGSADRLGGFSHGHGILAVGLVVGVVEFGLSQDLREHRHDLRLVKHHLGLAAKLRG